MPIFIGSNEFFRIQTWQNIRHLILWPIILFKQNGKPFFVVAALFTRLLLPVVVRIVVVCFLFDQHCQFHLIWLWFTISVKNKKNEIERPVKKRFIACFLYVLAQTLKFQIFSFFFVTSSLDVPYSPNSKDPINFMLFTWNRKIFNTIFIVCCWKATHYAIKLFVAIKMRFKFLCRIGRQHIYGTIIAIWSAHSNQYNATNIDHKFGKRQKMCFFVFLHDKNLKTALWMVRQMFTLQYTLKTGIFLYWVKKTIIGLAIYLWKKKYFSIKPGEVVIHI